MSGQVTWAGSASSVGRSRGSCSYSPSAASGRSGTSQGSCMNFCSWKRIQVPRSPVSPSGMRRNPDGTREAISRITDSASPRLTLPLKWT
jgi:hypothetical protein